MQFNFFDPRRGKNDGPLLMAHSRRLEALGTQLRATPPRPRRPEIAPRSAAEGHAFQAAEAFCSSLVESGRCHGVSVAVGQRGRVVYEAAFGSSAPTPGEGGLAPDRPVSFDSIWEVASITKPFTVLAVVQLIEKAGGIDGAGSFTLDTPVSSILPAFGGLPTGLPPAEQGLDRSSVTLRHLMTHTSGLADAFAVDRSTQPSLADHLDAVCTKGALQFAPGSDICYSSQGIMLLAGVVEAISGISLPAYLAANIFEPLGMHSTCLGEGLSQYAVYLCAQGKAQEQPFASS